MMRLLSIAFALMLMSVAFANADAQVVVSVPNAVSTGTTNGSVAKPTGAPTTAIVSATTDTQGFLGVVQSGGGTTGSALIVVSGITPCTFDAGNVVAGHWVLNSSTTAGNCKDGGAVSSAPTSSGQIIGISLATGSGSQNIVVLSIGGIASVTGCSVSGAVGIVLNNGSGGCATDTNITAALGALSLGASGTAGSIAMGNATSGTVTVAPVAGALGSVTASLPANTGTIAELNLVQSFTAAQTFAEVHGTTYSPTLTTNNYTLQASDCGKKLTMPAGTTGATVTLFNFNGDCSIKIQQTGTIQYTVTAAGGATFNSVNSFTKTKGQYGEILLDIMTPSASAAVWTLSGDGA